MVELDRNVLIDASFVPSQNLAHLVKGLTEKNQAIFMGTNLLLSLLPRAGGKFETFEIIQYSCDDVLRIEHTWDIFSKII